MLYCIVQINNRMGYKLYYLRKVLTKLVQYLKFEDDVDNTIQYNNSYYMFKQ